MATYVNDLRLKEIATGDESGTWGTSTNTNLELIGEALGYGTQNCFSSDANATTTVADGATDPARAMYFKVTSSATLSATRELTIAPNTVSRVMIIENATTGSQIITIKQGSGNTVNVGNGAVKVLYLDGAGSGAAVQDALVDLDLTGTTTAVTVTASGVITGLTVEATGDTAAGDNAAMGYTSTEGLILTGQGSTNDVTIKNDADADVLEIPTGTTNVTVVGDIITASTLQATGDTAAGDDAAIGYTSAEGLILMGQGSTNDVTIKNDADADVLEIPTGTTNVTVVGDIITASTLQATGDTAAGDDAAIGYTSAEGIIITGQGSSTDVTVKNDADATVMSIATGTTQATFAGEVVAASLDISGNIDVDGTSNLDAVDIDGAVQIDSTVTVGVDDTGYDVKFFGATSGAYMLWDESADDLKLVGAAGLTVAGDIDVDGTTNLDAVDIDGAVQIDSTVTVGADDTGYDVKFFGATASAYMHWDESEDDLILAGAAKLGVGTAPDVRLHVQENGEPPAEGMLILEANSASRQLRIQPPTNSDNGFIDYRGGNLTFLDDGTEVARFQGSDSFDLKGPKLKIYTSDDQVNYYAFYTHTDDTLRINYNNAGNDEWMMNSDGDVSIRGDLTQNASTSDIRLKEEISVIPDAVEKVESLRGVVFKFKETGKAGTGLIAQEVQKVLPEAVYTAPPRDEGDDLLALHYGNIVGLLVEAIKEQSVQIQALTKRVEELEN